MVYLIDFENTNSYGLDGLADIAPEDKVVIFFSDKAHTVDLEMISAFNQCKGEIHYIKGKTSKVIDGRETIPNYLDFQIATVVGSCIARGEEVAMISMDKGFVSVIDYWREDPLFHTPKILQLAKSIKEVKPSVRAVEVPEFVENTNIQTVTPDALQEILEKSPNQRQLHFNLLEVFGRIEGAALYEQYKDRYPGGSTKKTATAKTTKAKSTTRKKTK